MAVEANKVGCGLKMQHHVGQDGDGDPVYKTKTLNNVKTAAADQDIFDVANILDSLLDSTLVSIIRVDSTMLEEEI